MKFVIRIIWPDGSEKELEIDNWNAFRCYCSAIGSLKDECQFIRKREV